MKLDWEKATDTDGDAILEYSNMVTAFVTPLLGSTDAMEIDKEIGIVS